jgi:hypothetical protein
MILRTCPYDKRDGTRCNSPAVKGYDGCYFHSRRLRAQRHRTRVLKLLMQLQGKLSQRRLVWMAKELGCAPPPNAESPQLIIGESPVFATEEPPRVLARKAAKEWYDSKEVFAE